MYRINIKISPNIKNKAIKTYLFSLKDKSRSILLELGPRTPINIEIKKLLREGIIKYYSINHNQA